MSSREARSQTGALDTDLERRRALRVGLKKGLWTVGLACLIALPFLAAAKDSTASFWLVAIGIGLAGVALTWIGYRRWHAARRDDEGHHILQKVPSMPLRLLRDHHDAWLEGRVRCPQPLQPPGFRTHCSWFHLVVQELQHSGKKESWVTTRDETHGTSIWITDATREVEVDMREATVEYPEVLKQRQERVRMSLRHIKADGMVSACGLARYGDEMMGQDRADERDAALQQWREEHEAAIESAQEALAGEDKQARLSAQGEAIRGGKPGDSVKTRRPKDAWHLRSLDDAHKVPKGNRLVLTPHKQAPLLVTPLPRHRWHDHSEAGEVALRMQADIMLGFGVPAIVWAAGALLGAWQLAFWPGGVIGMAVMLVVVFPPRLVRLYNRFVAYRQRIRLARADLDADHELRNMLLPQLQAVVLKYSKHEEHVQTQLAGLRTKAKTLIALGESMPDLKADENFALLATDITAVEERIAFGRAQLEDAIAEYNTLVQSFPANMLAKMTGFGSESQAEDLFDE